MILFGHPTGNPNSHHAALAHWEAGRLDAFCVPWFPSAVEMVWLERIAGGHPEIRRLARRRFEPLVDAPKVQGRAGECVRLLRRKVGWKSDGLAYEANDWLMRKMARECRRPTVDAVHSYEDCSLWQFEEAKRCGKRCIYDMPIGYYGWWQEREKAIAAEYAAWLPQGGLPSSRWVRPEQKRREMELADLVLAPSRFVANTIREFFPEKDVRLAAYGGARQQPAATHGEEVLTVGTAAVADGGGLQDAERHEAGKCRFLFAGTASVRKGVPLLLDLWKTLGWSDAKLILAGGWQLAEAKRRALPAGASYVGRLDSARLARLYAESDWLVLPSNFEGFALVVLEALAAGLPVLASDATGAADLPPSPAVRVFPAGNREALAEALAQAKDSGHPELRDEARRVAAGRTWESYRAAVQLAVAG